MMRTLLTGAGLRNPNRPGIPESAQLSPLYERIWAGLDPTQVWDCHAHLVGTGDSGGDVWFSPRMDSLRHPLLWVQKRFYMNAGGVQEAQGGVDEQYVAHMVRLLDSLLVRGPKIMLLAFDYAHDARGACLPDDSVFHVSNTYAASVVQRYPDHFEWIASIHPYRPDAAELVRQVAAQGARAIKWLPSAQGIDPASPRCQAFYAALVATGLPLLSHAGREQAVPGGDQNDGNPLKLRHALNAGVRVIVAHCASDGHDIDLDQGAHGPKVRSYDLFARMMGEARYEHLLFADISAIALRNRAWALRDVLEHPEWHARLLNGTDYPLPGVMPLHSPAVLARAGLLDKEAVPFLNAIKPHNQLLFDLALKRLVRSSGNAFPTSVFETRRFFQPSLSE